MSTINKIKKAQRIAKTVQFINFCNAAHLFPITDHSQMSLLIQALNHLYNYGSLRITLNLYHDMTKNIYITLVTSHSDKLGTDIIIDYNIGYKFDTPTKFATILDELDQQARALEEAISMA